MRPRVPTLPSAWLSAAALVALPLLGAAPAAAAAILPIAEVQGAGPVSPYAGQTVTTEGVVTAAYPDGGFNGFYLQSAGTGGDVDPAGHSRSDGIFVYGSRAADLVRVGDHVQVSGPVSEYHGLTEIAAGSTGVTVLTTPAEAVKPATVPLPATDADREAFEGMLLAPQGPFTVADNYALNHYAEIGLATGTEPLRQPTDVADPHDAAAIAAVAADNARRSVPLDDGATTNFFSGSGEDTALPWLTQDHQIRVGAPATFAEPVVLDYRNGLWKLQPTSQLTADEPLPVTFGHTRTAAPEATAGNVRLASFNVLNYFPTTGAEFVAAGGTCSWYDDREGNHVTVNRCTGADGSDGPRGAADAVNLQRQQDKIVHAINALDADVVSLEEIENSAKFGDDRDAAVRRLVDALNVDAGAGTWAYARTPGSAGDQADEDVIRTAFVYRPAVVEPIGASVIDDAVAFDNARDPLAQAFEPVGGNPTSRFVVIVNHFKAKGSGVDDGTGQGNANPDRIAQAHELVAFAARMQRLARTDRVFLSGDFNSYTRADPMQVLYDAGYTELGSSFAPTEPTYLYDGLVGSLDHVLASPGALGSVTGADVWNINSVEPVALEYSRYHQNATDFYTPSPYRASDHDPLVVGLQVDPNPGWRHRP
jgi:predicted extracellular nuclease